MENYEILRDNLGVGSFGKVCLVRQISTGRLMVWKQINYSRMQEKQKQQLINEVNILRELRHENIVRYHDKILDKRNSTLYIIMEYCAGGDLGKLLKTCRETGTCLREDEIWGILM